MREVPSEETILQLLGEAPDRVSALAMAIAVDLADPEMTEESIGRMFRRDRSGVGGQGDTLPAQMARDWKQFREALWAFVRGDDKALKRIESEVIRFSRWTASHEPSVQQAYTWAALHVHLLHHLALALLESESVRNSTNAEMRRGVGRLMGSYMFNLLANIPDVRRGAQIHGLDTAARRERSRQYRHDMLREWWEAANRRLAVREGLGVQMQEGQQTGVAG